MIRFLLGVAVGAVGAAAYLNRQKGYPAINVGDGTPDRMSRQEAIA